MEKGANIPELERLMNVAYLGKVTVPFILYGDIFGKMLKRELRLEIKKSWMSLGWIR